MSPSILVVDDNEELLKLLQQLLEDAGYHVLAASKGKQAVSLAKESPPALALLDVLLPDMMGYHLADALRRDQPNLPLVFMTGVFKGGRHALEARSKYNAAGYFEKPFDAHKLLEAVAKQVPPGKPLAPPPSDAFDDLDVDIDIDDDEPQDPMELTGVIRVSGGSGSISAELRGANFTAASPVPGDATLRSPPATAAPKATPKAAPEGSKSKAGRGELKDNLPALINAFFSTGETGELGVQRGKVKKVVYFERGQPVFARSNLVTDRFGQFLVRVGKVKADQLQDAATVAQQTQRRTGDVLIERGLLKDTERLYYVGQQVKAIIYSLFAWEQATYVMSFEDKVVAESIKLDVHPANLITRGVKKLYTPERLKRLLAPEDRLIPSVEPAYPLHDVTLEKWEAELLPKVDGTRTIAELVAASGRPEHAVYAFLQAMMSLRILERRHA